MFKVGFELAAHFAYSILKGTGAIINIESGWGGETMYTGDWHYPRTYIIVVIELAWRT